MSYVVESQASAQARRRRRTAITLAVVAVVLAGAFYYAQSYWNRSASTPTSAASCTPTPGAGGQLAPGQVTVNVLNATKRSGLAGATAKIVKERGFVVGRIENDPLKKAVPQPAEVRYGPAGEASATLVLGLVAGAVPLPDTRADASVDLVLGEGFTALAQPTAPVPAPATATPTC
ncbi:MAG: LytR C-terminal domain-containing protein [Dermatophilaceae bacterium]